MRNLVLSIICTVPEFNPVVILGVSARMLVLHFAAITSVILCVLLISILLSVSRGMTPLKEGESPKMRKIARSTSFSAGGGGPPPVLCSLCVRAFSRAVKRYFANY